MRRWHGRKHYSKDSGGVGNSRNLSPLLANNCTGRSLTILELWSLLKAYNFQGKAWS
jgi:hypothetical protein